MKKRYFLQAGAAMVGATVLSRFVFGSSKPAAIAENTVTSATSHPFEVVKTEAEWRQILTPEQFFVLRQQGTERAGSSPLDHQFSKGTYHCAGCDLPLFTSATKYNSGTGWPSFYAPIEKAVGITEDRTFGIIRTEVHCRRCGGHLGHVFLDGPPPTGQRYCMNGVSLKFIPA